MKPLQEFQTRLASAPLDNTQQAFIGKRLDEAGRLEASVVVANDCHGIERSAPYEYR